MVDFLSKVFNAIFNPEVGFDYYLKQYCSPMDIETYRIDLKLFEKGELTLNELYKRNPRILVCMAMAEKDDKVFDELIDCIDLNSLEEGVLKDFVREFKRGFVV